MKKCLSLILAIAVAVCTLSACDTPMVESQVSSEASFTETILITEPIDDFGVDWVDEEDLSAFIDVYLPLNSERGQISLRKIDPAISSISINDQYIYRYCSPLLVTNFIVGEELNSYDMIRFAWQMRRYYTNVDYLTKFSTEKVAFPSAIVDEFAKAFFGIENIEHPIEGYEYDAEKSCYIIFAGVEYSAPLGSEVEKLVTNDDGSITIYYSLFNLADHPTTPKSHYYVTVKDNDDGHTWRYISGEEYFPEE